MNTTEIGLFSIDSFPALHWTSRYQGKDLVRISMMLPREINKKMAPLGQYHSEIWIAKEASEKLDEIKRGLPTDYVESLKNDMLSLFYKDGKRITRNTPNEFFEIMKEVRDLIDARCFHDLVDVDGDKKVKNLFLSTVRYTLGQELGDVFGD